MGSLGPRPGSEWSPIKFPFTAHFNNMRYLDCAQIVEHSSDNETVLGSSRKQGGAAEHLIEPVFSLDMFILVLF